jgi:regulator of CtrA degradation
MAIPATTTFFHRTYDEALGLLTEARNYVAAGEVRESGRLPPNLRMALCCETLRLTTRLTHVMAWLLAQRALHAGEITLEEAVSERFALGGAKVCLEESEYLARLDDQRLLTLLKRSLQLYIRVARLDAMVQDRAANWSGATSFSPGAASTE